MTGFWLCFIPLFVAMDALGILPIFIGLTEGLDPRTTRRAIRLSMATAAIVTLLFMAVGKAVLNLMGITLADFMVAGGILLLVISLSDLLTAEKRARVIDPESMGAVPLGVPLMVGPAVLTTTIILAGEYGALPAVSAVMANILVAGMVFSLAGPITALMGKTGTRTISKLTALILAAIAVMMVRKGITEMIG